MWYLVNENDPRVIYIAKQNKEVLIGRYTDPQAYCFVIAEDPSISRKHAILYNSNDELLVQDLGSRYGTFINNHNDKIESKLMIKLNNGDIVRFGKMNSIYKVHSKALVTCTSTVKGENLNNLRQCLINLSGTLKSDWDESCNYLTMPAITLTMKVVLALVQGAHIVTLDFWNKCLEAMNSFKVLPDPQHFIPQVIESTLNKENVSFLPNNQRQSLFCDKKVVFFSKRQFEMYRLVLLKASAVPLLLSECKMTKSALCENNVIVIQYNINAASQETQSKRALIQDIINYLKSKGKRLVTDVEIGLAILYCSTEKYCNPDFNFPSEIIKQTDQNTKSSNVLAVESQELSQSIPLNKENVIINESLTSTTSENEKGKCNKRKVCDDNDIQENTTKKMALNKTEISDIAIKRKVSESDNDIKSAKKFAPASGDSQDNFNFISKLSNHNTGNNQETSVKRLNLNKPQKRKLNNDDDDNEDNLFQFVQNKTKLPHNKCNIFDTDKATENSKMEKSPELHDKTKGSNNVDLASLRGAKLEELMKNNAKLLKSENVDICKKSIKEELDKEMSELNLGSTIVTIKKELVVKKEPTIIEEQSRQVKNFKKFKKVWPLKMQITIISRQLNETNKYTTMINKTQDCVEENAE